MTQHTVGMAITARNGSWAKRVTAQQPGTGKKKMFFSCSLTATNTSCQWPTLEPNPPMPSGTFRPPNSSCMLHWPARATAWPSSSRNSVALMTQPAVIQPTIENIMLPPSASVTCDDNRYFFYPYPHNVDEHIEHRLVLVLQYTL